MKKKKKKKKRWRRREPVRHVDHRIPLNYFDSLLFFILTYEREVKGRLISPNPYRAMIY